MSIKIDKDIPMPPRSVKGVNKYPLQSLKVGESFLASCKGSHMGGSIYLAKLKTGFQFSVRKEGTGCRVWRIK